MRESVRAQEVRKGVTPDELKSHPFLVHFSD